MLKQKEYDPVSPNKIELEERKDEDKRERKLTTKL